MPCLSVWLLTYLWVLDKLTEFDILIYISSSLASELVLLEELEEVLDFKDAIFGHVRAVNCIPDSVKAVLGSITTKFDILVFEKWGVSIFRLPRTRETYLMVSGRKCLAISGSWGPHSSRKEATAFYYRISSAMTGPPDIFSIMGKYSGRTPLYTS